MADRNESGAGTAAARIPDLLDDAQASDRVHAQRVPVLLPFPFDQPFDYAVPNGIAVEPGSYVVVPLGRRSVIGVVWDRAEADATAIEPKRLKPIEEALSAPPMPAVHRRFIDWVAAYTLTPPGQVMRMALNRSGLTEAPRSRTGYHRSHLPVPDGLRLTPARRRVLDLTTDAMPRPATEIAAEAGCSVGVIHGLAGIGLLDPVEMRAAQAPEPDPAHAAPDLSPDQAAALEIMTDATRVDPILLDGVTGSGKTAVYFEAIAQVIACGRQALVLLPEIALTAQFLERFEARFGARPALWHSDVAPPRRREVWRGVAGGRARVVVGARSALFLPFPDLGLIVVDEEHDQAFKQEDGATYHARDMAIARANLTGIPIVLVSATPSLETLNNVWRGRYRRAHLPERHGPAGLPAVVLVDLRKEKRGRHRWLSPPMVEAVRETLAAGEQSLLFLNRRGYAPLTLCSACGHRLSCPQCSAWVVEHRLTGRVHCHHCGYTAPLPSVCPACGAEDSTIAVGPGVERIEEEVADLFPDARRTVLSSDLTTDPGALRDLIAEIERGEIDIVIGTQMVAKGHHFPMLTLVGVVDADMALAGGDLRAAERTFQLLHQVAGRAGRAAHPGRALIQTHSPDHRVMQALVDGDLEAFLGVEADERRLSGAPPFRRFVAVIVSGPDEATVEGVARALGQAAPDREDVDVIGPAAPPLALLRGRHRRRLLVRADRATPVQAIVRRWIAQISVPSTVRVQVDVDPQSFL